MVQDKLATHDFGQHVEYAFERTKETKEGLKSLLSGIKAGRGETGTKCFARTRKQRYSGVVFGGTVYTKLTVPYKITLNIIINFGFRRN
ncbi:hypothetical protein J2S00_003821 [Caldalkalibacillus uzonensis]|uniref:Uncharacterized protein n=1 Tax=Caldalkalibacillus uzonensis TaxID=353224 RepID=A0ABU0CXU9_9BACI|nr:hypothetical protein [Caldalkalibacillus uzonensis]